MGHVLNLHVLVLLLVRPQTPCVTGHVQVVGPAQPVVAAVGQDVVLPCHLEPAANASEMTVEWTRPDLEPRFVYVWRDGVELESKKHPVYKGRTSVFSDELKHGNISLKLSRVRISDEGRYRCFIPDVGDSSVQLIPGKFMLNVSIINIMSLFILSVCYTKCAVELYTVLHQQHAHVPPFLWFMSSMSRSVNVHQ
uniref:Ig-like domain-containing protein n=1 Tax=Sparus aurata TaxID=8175 RepID=A0A671TN34_SPAAU